MLGIVCGCEGELEQPHGGPVIHCTRCRREYPFKELRTISMLIRKALYTPSSEQQTGATEPEKRAAINKAASKIARLKLRIIEIEEPAPQPVAPRSTVYPQTVYTTTSWAGNTVYGNVYIRVNIYSGGVS